MVVSFGSEGLYAYDMAGTLLWKQDLGVLDPVAHPSGPVAHRGLLVRVEHLADDVGAHRAGPERDASG